MNTRLTRRAALAQVLRGWPTVALSAAALALVGCASFGTREQPPASVWSGRLALSIAATPGQPARGFTASFELRGEPARGELSLSGPLGAQALRVSWAPGRYELDTGSGPQAYPSIDSLMQAGVGESLPLPALFDWLQGRAWPDAPHSPLPDGFAQLGWRLDTQQLGEGWVRAQRDAGQPHAHSPALSLRIRLQQRPAPDTPPPAR
ncbi:MAG: outer membrane lipoprotein LolB [Rubrivivax sp.]|nr:outer membrane lipoprotein LolB [Rubrivivax sp.]